MVGFTLSTSFHCPNSRLSHQLNSQHHQNPNSLPPARNDGDDGGGGLDHDRQWSSIEEGAEEAVKAREVPSEEGAEEGLGEGAKEERGERKQKEWEERVAGLSEEEGEKLIGSRRGAKERVEKQLEERENKVKRLIEAKTKRQNIVVDLEFSDLMTPSQIKSGIEIRAREFGIKI